MLGGTSTRRLHEFDFQIRHCYYIQHRSQLVRGGQQYTKKTTTFNDAGQNQLQKWIMLVKIAVEDMARMKPDIGGIMNRETYSAKGTDKYNLPWSLLKETFIKLKTVYIGRRVVRIIQEFQV